MTAPGRGFFAVDRHQLRNLVDRLGGDDARILLHLAIEADPDTGIVRGNLHDLGDRFGAPMKRMRAVLPRLEAAGFIVFHRGKNGEGRGAGSVQIVDTVALDARPRTAPKSAGVNASTAPTPRPRRARTAPDRAGVPRDDANKTEDRRQKTRDDSVISAEASRGDHTIDDMTTAPTDQENPMEQLTIIHSIDVPATPNRKSRAKPSPAWSDRTRALAGQYLDWHQKHHHRPSPVTFAGLCTVVTKFELVDDDELLAAMKNARSITTAAVDYNLKAARGVGAKPAKESQPARIHRLEQRARNRDALSAIAPKELTA